MQLVNSFLSHLHKVDPAVLRIWKTPDQFFRLRAGTCRLAVERIHHQLVS
ncbi:hypothetical protein ACSYGW_15880 [Bacillus glycinifermentans]